jgi:hypothetical protein
MMPPGNSSSVFIATQGSQAAYDAVTRTAFHHRILASRNAALLELADRDLGSVSESVIVALGIQTGARRVCISAEQQRLIIEKRQVASRMDAELVALRLTEALANVLYHRLPQQQPNTFALVGFVVSKTRHLVLVLKLVEPVHSKTGQEEWWVKTAYPIGARTFRKTMAGGHLVLL